MKIRIRKMKSTLKPLTVSFLIIMLFLGIGPASAAQLEVGPTQLYTTIQNGVDAGNDGDIINVHQGIYAEDVVVNKRLTIQANQGEDVEVQPTNTGFTVINNGSGDGSGTTIDGFKITNSPTSIGVNISAEKCTVKNNQITDGLTGIVVKGDNTIITGNEISQAQKSGISLFGCNPTISGNKIMNMVGGGSKAGIQLATINFTGSTGLTITGNTLSNIHSNNDTVLGIDAFAMTMNATLDNLFILGNTISDLYGIGKVTALSIVPLALNGPLSTIKLMENTITNVTCQGVNSTSTAISLVAMGFKNDAKTYNNTTSADSIIISKNKIAGINSEDENGTSKGISVVQLCTGNASISENNVSNFKANMIALGISYVGVDYTTFQSNGTLNNNTITDLTANNITSGIQCVNLGNSIILHNSIFRLNSQKTKYIMAQTPLMGNTTIKGNNLEGSGIGEGIAVGGNHTTINYNRVVNFQHYIQNINLTESMEFSGQSLPTDQQIRDYLLSKNGTYVNGTYINITDENITTIITGYHKFMDSLDSISSNTTAPYNWYGTNNPGNDKFLRSNGTLDYSPWLILNIKADPSTINIGQTSKISADVYTDSAGGDHSADAPQFFSGPQVTFTTNLGNVGSKSVVVQWVNGAASAILRADEGAGIATVTATDYQTAKTFVTIFGASSNSTVVNAARNTIGMQTTGTPINYLIFAILMVMGGLVASRKK